MGSWEHRFHGREYGLAAGSAHGSLQAGKVQYWGKKAKAKLNPLDQTQTNKRPKASQFLGEPHVPQGLIFAAAFCLEVWLLLPSSALLSLAAVGRTFAVL